MFEENLEFDEPDEPKPYNRIMISLGDEWVQLAFVQCDEDNPIGELQFVAMMSLEDDANLHAVLSNFMDIIDQHDTRTVN